MGEFLAELIRQLFAPDGPKWRKVVTFAALMAVASLALLLAASELTGYRLRDFEQTAPTTVGSAGREQLRLRLRAAVADGSVSADEAQELSAFAVTLGDEATAAEAYVAELQPRLLQALREIREGTDLAARGSFAEARLHFREATSLDGDNASAWANFGGAALELGDLAEAEAALRKAVALAPDELIANYNLAACLAAQNQDDAAFDHLEHAVSLLRNEKSFFDPNALRGDLQQSPHFATLRSSPRFSRLLERLP